jgi:DeoR/GlpR family transcriptional regulator of sugar metabolism
LRIYAGISFILVSIAKRMLKKERLAYIMHQVNLHNKVLSANLCQDIAVSDDTIRRDLQELIKVHGGALSNSFHKGTISNDQIYSYYKKATIAQKAATLVKEGMFVLTGGGTTIIELAKALPPELHATFISGSIPAIAEYINHPSIDVIMLGDRVSKNARLTVGPDAIAKIKQIRSDICFLGINAIDINYGVSDNDWDVVQIKKTMIEAAKKVVCLTISEKINTQQPIQVCALNQIDMLITELPSDDPLLQPYVDAGVQVL